MAGAAGGCPLIQEGGAARNAARHAARRGAIGTAMAPIATFR